MATSPGGDRVRASLRGLIDLHRSPRTEIRLGVWGAWVCLLVLALRAGPIRQVALGVWMVANSLLLLISVAWGVFHIRAMWRAQGTALRWAFALAVLLTAALSSRLQEQLDQFGAARVAGLGYLYFFLMLAAGFFPLGFCGAALGCITRRESEDPGDAAARGITGWWLAVSLLGAGYAAAGELLETAGGEAELAVAAYFAAAPALAALLSRVMAREAYNPRLLVSRTVRWLARRLVVDRTIRGRRIRVDLRGASLGLLAAVMVLSSGGLGMLEPLRTRGLTELMFVRSVLLARVNRLVSAEADLPIVVLQMDGPVQRRARTESSEAGLQAAVIRRLAEYGARAVVLTPPLGMAVEWAETIRDPEAWADAPVPTEADISRSQGDLPELLSAMEAAGNVYLAVPSDNLGQGGVGSLSHAAKGSGNADLEFFGEARLPVIPVAGTSRVPLAVLLYAELTGQPTTARVRGVGHLELGGKVRPTIAGGQVLIDYSGPPPTGRFRHLGYSAVLGGQPVFTRDWSAGQESRDAWVEPAEYFRGKVVFLDALARTSYDTPLGTLSAQELWAYALSTLLTERHIGSVSPVRAGLLTLLTAILIGQMSLKRDPLSAAWRLAVVSLILVVWVTARFLASYTWIDPIEPLAAAAIAAMLVTQLTLVLERDERERNRALLQRFVAPQVVDELLEDPEGNLGLGGKRREVCVLFADVRGFTPFSERHTPEEVIDVINAYMTAMTIALHNHGGLLDKYTGDGLMAIFRVGDEREADLLRAVRAGLEMRDAAQAISAELERHGQDPLEIGLAAHCGPAVVGLVGNPNQFNYTALGYTVVVTQRLETLAAGGEFLISDALFREVAERVHAAAGGPVRVKGISEPIRPFSVTGLKPPPATADSDFESTAIDLPL